MFRLQFQTHYTRTYVPIKDKIPYCIQADEIEGTASAEDSASRIGQDFLLCFHRLCRPKTSAQDPEEARSENPQLKTRRIARQTRLERKNAPEKRTIGESLARRPNVQPTETLEKAEVSKRTDPERIPKPVLGKFSISPPKAGNFETRAAAYSSSSAAAISSVMSIV